MPIPRIVRQWNKAGLNRVTKHIAPWTPGFGVVVHRGRRSSQLYQTPVNVFATEDGYAFALTYGPDTDWVKNVLAPVPQDRTCSRANDWPILTVSAPG